MRVIIPGIVILLLASLIHAQDRRAVIEPQIPKSCVTLTARIPFRYGTLTPEDERAADTARIQNAIDRCSPGAAVVLRADGINAAFLSGPLELRPRVTLVVAEGATLFGSRDPRDYDLVPGSCGNVDKSGKGCRPLIHASNAPGSGVMGDGIIDGRGGEPLIGQRVSWWDLARQAKARDEKQNVPRLIVADRSDSFTLYRITLRNSPNFHAIVSRSTGFTAWGVKVDSPSTARNTDGIDVSSAKDVSILHCYIRCGDDDVAVKAGDAGPSEYITVAHSHFYSGHGMSIGSETNGGVNDVEVEDLTIDGADNGIRIKSNTSRGGLVRAVAYQNVCMRQVRNPLVIDPFYGSQRGRLIPEFRDIVLRNVFAATPGNIVLLGADRDHDLRIALDSVYVEGSKVESPRIKNARVSIGRGGVNFGLRGDNVAVIDLRNSGAAGSTGAGSCTGNFVPFPEARSSRSEAFHNSSTDRALAREERGRRRLETITVAADGSGDFRSVQQAIDSLPESGGAVTVKPGIYRETVTVNKPNVRIGGDNDPSKVEIVFSNSAGAAGGTLKSATVSIRGDGFFASGITFANDFSKGRELAPQGAQAVALLVAGDRAVFKNVRILGAQDTLYVGSKSCASEQGPCVPARQYFSDCYIEGNVDFIFGDGKAFFNRCEIHAIRHKIVMLTAQSKHYPDENSGFVFERCRITADPGTSEIYLGRPWRTYSTVVFMDTDIEARIEPDGWREWHPGETHSLETAYYAEFHSRGLGSDTRHREPYSKQLTVKESRRFSRKEFLEGSDGWHPDTEEAAPVRNTERHGYVHPA